MANFSALLNKSNSILAVVLSLLFSNFINNLKG